MRGAFFLLFLFCMQLFGAERSGPYLGIGYGNTLLNDKDYFGLKKKESPLYAAYAGAYINENLSVEVEYAGGMEYEKISSKKQQFAFLDINTQAHYPFLNDEADVFIKVGTGSVTTKNNSGVAFVFGAGVAYRFMKRYAFKAVYDYLYFGVDTNGDELKDVSMHTHIVYGALEVQF